MIERKFDYENVANISKNIQNIASNKDSANSIVGILERIDKKISESINVEDEAIYGELGHQLLLDWENTRANFGSFVNNFENWSALIVKSAGNYKEFENRVQGFRMFNNTGINNLGNSMRQSTNYYSDSNYYDTQINDK